MSGALFATPPGCKGGEVVCTKSSKKGKPVRACTVKKPKCTTVGKMARRKHYRNAWGNPPLLSHWQKISPMVLLAGLNSTDVDLPRLYLQCGDQDKRFHRFMEEAHRLLDGNGIDHVRKSIPGGNHSWKTWNAETRLWLKWLEKHWREDDKKKRPSEKTPASPRNTDDTQTRSQKPTPPEKREPAEKKPQNQ